MKETRHWTALHRFGAVACALVLSWSGIGAAELPDSGNSLTPQVATLHGIVRPYREVELKSAVQGVLKSVLVVEGEDVESGQRLATLDDRLARAAVLIAKAKADQTARSKFAEYELKLAENLVNRLTIVGETKVASEFELDKAIARRDQAHESLAESVENQLLAQRQLELEQARLENHCVRAPFRGKVLKINGVPGGSVDGQQPVLILAQLSKLKAELHLPVALFGKMRAGKVYGLRSSEPVNQVLKGRLIYSATVIDAGTRTFRCVFEIANSDGQLPAGFAVTLNSSTPLVVKVGKLTNSANRNVVKSASSHHRPP